MHDQKVSRPPAPVRSALDPHRDVPGRRTLATDRVWEGNVQFTVTETIAAVRHDVVRAMGDPAYYSSLGDSSSSVRPPELLSATTDGGSLRVSVRYAFAGTITGPAAMVVDVDKLTWVIETDYDSATHSGTLVVVPDNYEGMLRCSGILTLTESDGATVEMIVGNLDVRVPFVSGAAEKAIIGGFTRQFELEAVAMAAWCAR